VFGLCGRGDRREHDTADQNISRWRRRPIQIENMIRSRMRRLLEIEYGYLLSAWNGRVNERHVISKGTWQFLLSTNLSII
jgi:hypothetical protein